MTPLAAALIRRIAADGPMTVADFMGECLLHPVHGYYSTRDPFGVAGDFTTAPEISQMFGELLGLCLAQAWHDQGAPPRFTLAELGPGRGTLMADVLRATRGVSGFHAAAEVVLVEASDTLRGVQARTLANHADIHWTDTVADLVDQPLFLLANEFFDALPVRQYERGATGWHERQVGMRDDSLVIGLSAMAPLPDARFAPDPPGTVVEISPQAQNVMTAIGTVITRNGGVAIVIDYGGWRSKGDTLQALRAHQSEDPLASPGQADLTSHVDFEALAMATDCPHTGLTEQGLFLKRLGIDQRAARLAVGQSGAALQNHLAALHRLTDPAEMGSLFKAIAFHAPGTPPPPGFDPGPDA
jgi:NADH dehydrogenase [ubiquinone] 1 alpha subcomplex assembly factor 7